MDIGSRLEPFVDRTLIDSLSGTRLEMHRPERAGKVLAFDRPWEGRYSGYATIMDDGGLLRMYYRGHPVDAPDGSPSESTCYAESRDGVCWTKPDLGLFEVHGTRDNNVILSGLEPFSHNFAPFPDKCPGVAESEQFKAVAGVNETGLILFASTDGIRWRKLQDEPILTKGAFDSHNLVFWSEAEECYCCYFRSWTEAKQEGGFGGLRAISRATSDDFLHWSDPVRMDYGDAPFEELYTNQTLPYFRAPHIYVAIAARFMSGRRVLSPDQFAAVGGEGHYGEDCSDAVLMTSRGGNVYERTFMEGFVRPGMGLSNWTSRTNYPAHGLVPTGDSEMSCFITREYGQPTAHLERLVLRLDGFVSVNAPYSGGEMATKTFTFDGARLVMNYSTSAAGSLRVEIQDEQGVPIDGFTETEADETVGDEIDRAVSWCGETHVDRLRGRPVRLRFIMKDADLYSIRFVP